MSVNTSVMFRHGHVASMLHVYLLCVLPARCQYRNFATSCNFERRACMSNVIMSRRTCHSVRARGMRGYMHMHMHVDL